MRRYNQMYITECIFILIYSLYSKAWW